MTIKEFAEAYLAPPIAERFINGVKSQRTQEQYDMMLPVDLDRFCAWEIVDCYLHWRSTPEGHNYWSAITAQLREWEDGQDDS